MRTQKKNMLAVLGAIAFVSVGTGAYTAVSVSVNAEESNSVEIAATTEVAFRVNGDYGLRIDTTIDKDAYDLITAENSNITTGVLVIPTDLLKGDLTLETAYVATGVTYDATAGINEWVVSEDGETAEAYAYLVDIPKMSYTRNLTLRSYYTVDGVPTYLDATTTSLTCVAQELLTLDEQDDTILTDEIETLVSEYVSDYTVVFKNELTNTALSRTAVSPETATVAKPETDPTVEGYTFKGWYVGDTEWNFETGTITGDTLIAAKYDAIQYAPLVLDFSEYTVIPAYVTENTKGDMYLENGKLMNKWAYINNQGIYIAYDSLELKAGDKIIVTAELVQGNFNVYANGSYLDGYKSAVGDVSCTITLNKDITLTSLGIVSSNDNLGSKYIISSVVIEMQEREVEEKYASLNLDFANYETLPSFVSYTTELAPTIANGAISAWHADKTATKIAYDNVVLKAGDTITITVSTTTAGVNIDLNGTYYKWVGANTTETVTITLTGDMTLETIAFRCSSANGSTYTISSIVINKA